MLPSAPLLPAGSMNWITCRAVSGGIEALLDDFDMCAPHLDCPELGLVREALQLCRPALELRGLGESGRPGREGPLCTDF